MMRRFGSQKRSEDSLQQIALQMKKYYMKPHANTNVPSHEIHKVASASTALGSGIENLVPPDSTQRHRLESIEAAHNPTRSSTTSQALGSLGHAHSISYLDSKSIFYKKQISKFASRGFLKPEEQEYFVSDKVCMLLKETCSECKTVLYPKDILRNTTKETDHFYIF